MAITISEYSRTTWVNDSAPDIDADHLNKIENALYADRNSISDLSDAVTADKVLVLTGSSISSLPYTISNSNITASHVVVNSVLSNPSAQTGDWTVTTAAGSLTISGSISETTNITLYLALRR